MALKGNKGEWSEIYTLLKLLGDTQVYSGDEDLVRVESLFYPIIKILRTESAGSFCYTIDCDMVIVSGGSEELRIPVSIFSQQASSLLIQIQRATGSSFSFPDTEAFLASIHCQTLKASSVDKTDIRIIIHDQRTGNNPLLGFSIKSKLGHPSTLLNPGTTTNFIFTIEGANPTNEQIEQINAIDSKPKIQDRITKLYERGCTLKFSTIESSVFLNNLILIDSSMPKILAHMLKLYYKDKLSNIKDIALEMQRSNPMGYDTSSHHNFYQYKIKRLLTDIALGMTPAKVWNGHYDANGGYLVVKEDGEVLCYHIYNQNAFEDYLLNNTRIDTPSSTRYKFGKIETCDGILTIKLNLQIRFK